MIGRPSVLNAAFGSAHRLLWKSLQPQNPPKEDASRYSLVDLKTNDMRPTVGGEALCERALDMAPRTPLIAEVML